MEKTVNDACILRGEAIKGWAAEKFVSSSTIVVPAQQIQIAKMVTFVGNKGGLGLFCVCALVV